MKVPTYQEHNFFNASQNSKTLRVLKLFLLHYVSKEFEKQWKKKRTKLFKDNNSTMLYKS